MALLGCDGYCVFAHSVNGVECARKVWAVRCAPFLPDSEEAFNSFFDDGFHVPELKGESESSGGIQAGNVNNEALHVIGLHGSGDKISLFLLDWELAKVALSCHMALDMLCQEMYEVERNRWLVWVLNEPAG